MFNNIGLRGRDVSDIKQEKRILILGSSYTFAGEVKQDQKFTHLLEKKFVSVGKKVRVINGGLPDASVAEFLYYIPWLTDHLKPDLIVIQLVPKDFSRAIKWSNGLHILLNSNGEYTLVENQEMNLKEKLIEQPLYRFFLARSGLFAYLNIRLRNFLSVKQDGPSIVQSKTVSSQSTLIKNSQTLIRNVLHNWSNNTVPISLLILPEGDAYRGFDTSDKEAALAQTLQKTCLDFRMSCIDMKKPLLEEFIVNHNLAKSFVNSTPVISHLNSVGHEVVAAQLFKELGQVSL